MLSLKLLDKLNEAARNPSIHQVIIANLETKEAVLFDRKRMSLECVCPFCVGQALIMTPSHINIAPLHGNYGFIKNYGPPKLNERPQNTEERPESFGPPEGRADDAL